MKRYLAAAALIAGLMFAGCGQSNTGRETTAPESGTVAVSETSAPESETAIASETAAQSETEVQTESEAAVPESETAAPESETEMQAESEAAVPESETPAPGGARQDGVYSAAEIRQSQDEMCAAIDNAKAAFGVLVVDPDFEGSWPDVEAAVAFSGYADKYPYLTSIGFEQFIETDGKGLICIIPRDMATTLSVDLVDEDLEVRKVLYRHEMAHPLLVRANLDPKEPELMITGVSGDYKATFYLMTEKGKLLMPNGGGVYDFTEE